MWSWITAATACQANSGADRSSEQVREKVWRIHRRRWKFHNTPNTSVYTMSFPDSFGWVARSGNSSTGAILDLQTTSTAVEPSAWLYPNCGQVYWERLNGATIKPGQSPASCTKAGGPGQFMVGGLLIFPRWKCVPASLGRDVESRVCRTMWADAESSQRFGPAF